MSRTSFVSLADASALFELATDTTSNATVARKVDRNTARRLQRAEQRGMVSPIVVKDENGTRIADAATLPAHLRRYYGLTTVARTKRARPHRNLQGIRGGQRGNGALHDGRVHGLTPTGKV